MEKISSAQKKIIMVASFILLANLAFWLFIYLPSKNTVARIKSELLNVESQLQEIEVIIGKTESIDESIRLLVGRYQELNDRFPQKEEESIRALSHLTRKLNIELISIKPQPKEVFLDENKKEVNIEGRTCQRIFISIEMNCFYKDLVKYIETLKEALPGFVTVERLKVNKDSLRIPRLNIGLDINLYLLS